MTIRLLVAAAENDVIGRGNELPWRLPGDLKRFAALTRGHALVMGRVTYDSILSRLGKPLPGRRNVVVTRSGGVAAATGVEVVTSVEEAVRAAEAYTGEQGLDDWFVIGGAAVYRELLPRVDAIDLTRVHAEVDGDVRMPPGWLDGFVARATEPAADDAAEFPYSFVTLVRERSA
jgi:dihydrofolate reductase